MIDLLTSYIIVFGFWH